MKVAKHVVNYITLNLIHDTKPTICTKLLPIYIYIYFYIFILLYHTEHSYVFQSAGDHHQGIEPKQSGIKPNKPLSYTVDMG